MTIIITVINAIAIIFLLRFFKTPPFKFNPMKFFLPLTRYIFFFFQRDRDENKTFLLVVCYPCHKYFRNS